MKGRTFRYAAKPFYFYRPDKASQRPQGGSCCPSMAAGPTANISCPSFRPRPSGRVEEPAVLTWAAVLGNSRFLHSGLTPSGRNDSDKGTTGGPTANISMSVTSGPSFRPRPSGRVEEPAVLTWAAMLGKSRFFHSGLRPRGRNDNDKAMAGGPTANISMSVICRPRPSGRAEEPAVLTWAAMLGNSRFLHSGLTPSGRNDNDKGMTGGPTANISMSVTSCPSFRPRPSGRVEEPAVLTWAAMLGKSRFFHSGLTPCGRNDNDKAMAGGPTANISYSSSGRGLRVARRNCK